MLQVNQIITLIRKQFIRKSSYQSIKQSNQTQSNHHFFVLHKTAGSAADKGARARVTTKQASSVQANKRATAERNDDLPTEYPSRSSCSQF
jgi:hypothetical protein|mmetsp:Transcript_21026/g.35923  ORF Transcript_21026/g.35923 Transcript_21026/m.35923 type:complete len:91 (-) Transcript_21026:813-1085(-)